jgi:hypothetical protein
VIVQLLVDLIGSPETGISQQDCNAPHGERQSFAMPQAPQPVIEVMHDHSTGSAVTLHLQTIAFRAHIDVRIGVAADDAVTRYTARLVGRPVNQTGRHQTCAQDENAQAAQENLNGRMFSIHDVCSFIDYRGAWNYFNGKRS